MTYWQKRAIQNQQKADKIAGKYIEQQRRYYKQGLKRIEGFLSSLLLDMEVGKPITRTNLWRMVKYTKLKQEIENFTREAGLLQIADIDELANRLYSEVLGLTLEEFREQGFYTAYNQEQVRQILTTAFESENYSQRVWAGDSVANRINRNCFEIGQRIQKDVEELICLGKSVTEIKKRLMNDFGVAFYEADRLIRTESMYVYNSAAKAGYQAAGVKQIEFLPEQDERCCDECKDNAGIYDIDKVPFLPVHPMCRCCYVPVVDLTT